MSTSAVAPRLSFFQRELLAFVESKARLRQGLCLATKTIAAHFGVTVRYVQKALKKLRELGEISREWDYGLRTRRRFYLGSEQPLLMNEREGVESTNSGASIDESPPIGALESVIEGIGDGVAVESSPHTIVESRPKADPIDSCAVSRLAGRVAKATRPDPTLPARMASVAKKWGIPWLAAAVQRLERKARFERIESPVGLIVNTLRGFKLDGGPPPTEEELYAQNHAAVNAELESAMKLWGITT